MNKSLKIYLFVFGIVVLLLTLLELNKTEIIDWSKTYDVQDTSPFGLYVFNQEADELFDNNLDRVDETPYTYFTNDNSSERRNYLFINNEITAASTHRLLEKVASGDNAMFLVPFYTTALADSLGLVIDYVRYQGDNTITLRDIKFAQDSIKLNRLPENLGITDIDTLTTDILGTSLESNNEAIANFVRVRHGKGNVYVHVEPTIFTNYYLLNDNHFTFAENVLSYLPKRKTVWFMPNVEVENPSVMRFILSQKSLRYAWYTFVLGLLIFAIFSAKRRQRIVPIIEPKKNNSAEFVQTIGNLYLQEGSYKDMAKKKATYFLNKLRSELHIDTHALDEGFIHKLHLKTGADRDTIQKAIPLIEKAMHEQAPIHEIELIELNNLLDQILQNH